MTARVHRLLTCSVCGDVVGSDSRDNVVLLGRPPEARAQQDTLLEVKCLYCGGRTTLPQWIEPAYEQHSDQLVGSEML